MHHSYLERGFTTSTELTTTITNLLAMWINAKHNNSSACILHCDSDDLGETNHPLQHGGGQIGGNEPIVAP